MRMRILSLNWRLVKKGFKKEDFFCVFLLLHMSDIYFETTHLFYLEIKSFFSLIYFVYKVHTSKSSKSKAYIPTSIEKKGPDIYTSFLAETDNVLASEAKLLHPRILAGFGKLWVTPSCGLVGSTLIRPHTVDRPHFEYVLPHEVWLHYSIVLLVKICNENRISE